MLCIIMGIMILNTFFRSSGSQRTSDLVLFILFFFFKTLFFGDPVAGFPATICIVLLLGGIQLFCVGILGQYLSKTYLETKKRPLYIVRERS